ncbi:MAG: replication-associated recombination protein A [Phototrophicales bacterium]|nr:replication-associated recombination protein A [Phototrophicales bacterium]
MQNITNMQPLADRIRPKTLDEFIGQKHLVGEGKPIYQMIKQGRIHSMLFWGPPGVGKTTLARIIAHHTGMELVMLSAVSAGKDDLRRVVTMARGDLTPIEKLAGGQSSSKGVLLFLDEIHRFNKAQQDFLLPYVEDGTITLIGATTENPSFEVISALLSRSQVFTLQSLSEEDLHEVVMRGLAELGMKLDEDGVAFLANFANGDGRNALNLLEATARLYADDADGNLRVEHVRNALQSKHLRYDKADEEHYDTISAYIKCMRASDVSAALYYLARMVHAGEDPKFIARRMVIFASEDIGMALPTALVVANEVFRAVEVIGYPECQINLAHGTAYLASAPKSRASYDAYFMALDDVAQHGNLPIPLHLRNAPTKLMKELGYGDGYQMYGEQNRLPEKLNGRNYYLSSGE